MLVMLDKALRLAFTLLKSMWFSFWRKEWCCLIYWRSLDLVQKLCPKQGFASFLAVLWLVTARQAFQIYRHCLEGLFLYLWLDIYMTSFVKADSRVCWNDSCSALLYKKGQTHNQSILPCWSLPSLFPVAISLWLSENLHARIFFEFRKEDRKVITAIFLLFFRKTQIRWKGAGRELKCSELKPEEGEGFKGKARI